jgi:hypothetical protein
MKSVLHERHAEIPSHSRYSHGNITQHVSDQINMPDPSGQNFLFSLKYVTLRFPDTLMQEIVMVSMALRLAIMLVALVLTGFGISFSATAAPQVLGIVATAAPVPLRCEGDTCVAYLASFCLEPDRAHPVAGTRYIAADAARFVVSGADTKIVASALSFRAAHFYTSVRIELPRSALGGNDQDNFSISVQGGAALVPTPVAGDREPHTVAGIATAIGAARELAASWFDRADPDMEAAQLVSQTLSGLPRYGRVDDQVRETAWRSAAKSKSAFSPAGFAQGKLAVSICRRSVELGIFQNLRVCLNMENNRLLGHRNTQFWKALKTGS